MQRVDHQWTTASWCDPVGRSRATGDIVRWVCRGEFLGWYTRYRDVDGQRRQEASHQPTKALADRMLLEIETRVARGMAGIPESAPKIEPMSVAELCECFLGEFASPRVKDLGRYRSAARTALRRVLHHIGHLQLSALNRNHIERARDTMARQFKPNTVRASMAPFGTALTWAVRQGLLSSNPARGIEMPRREPSTENLSEEEASRLLAEAERRAREKNSPLWWSRFIL